MQRWARRHRTVWHVDIGEYKESWHKILKDKMAAGKDRNVRRAFGWVGTECRDLVAAAGTETGGLSTTLASQHYSLNRQTACPPASHSHGHFAPPFSLFRGVIIK